MRPPRSSIKRVPFIIDFFLAHADKLAERVPYYSEKHLRDARAGDQRRTNCSPGQKSCTVETAAHPASLAGVELQCSAFPQMPFIYRQQP